MAFRDRFNEVYGLLMESISSPRKPIQKVDAMPPKDFIRFLKEFLPYVKDGKVDLKDIRISEKVDGQSLKLLTCDGEMMFESSYSGVATWENVPMKEAAKFLYDNYSQLFHDISELIGSDFKLIGELIWIDEMEESGKVTPVGASYLTEKFGRHGGMVVFDIMRIEGDRLVPFPEDKEEEIFGMIRDLNDDDFSFYLSDSIDITKRVTFTLDADSILKLVSGPEFSKERFDKRKDAKLLSEIEEIKRDVCRQLSQTIDGTKGAFSAEGDLIEGIVIRVNGSGNQYGAFSDGYREMKRRYWSSFEKVEPIWREFFKAVFGCIPLRKKVDLLPKLEEDPGQFKAAFDRLRPEYLERMQAAVRDLADDGDVPKAVKRVQMSMAMRQVSRLQEPDYFKFLERFVVSKEN